MKLLRFRYSPYARKIQAILDFIGEPYELVEVRYGEREALARLTGGYIYVPVLELDDGTALTESRRIAAHLLAHPAAQALVPSAFEALVWAYHDFVEGPVEDTLFRVASGPVRDAWPTAWERALYTLIKERKYGAGCIDAWVQDTDALIDRARATLTPTFATLTRQPFVCGDALTFADLALFGQWKMLDEAAPGLLARLSPTAVAHAARVDAALGSRRPA